MKSTFTLFHSQVRAGMILLFIPLCLTHIEVSAQPIQHYDIHPDTVIAASKTMIINITKPLASAMSDTGEIVRLGNHSGGAIDPQMHISTGSKCQVSFISSGFWLAALSYGATIDNALGNWYSLPVMSAGIFWDGPTSWNEWHMVTDKYIAVRVDKGGQWYYGWIKMDTKGYGTAPVAVVKEYAFNTVPNTPIQAGFGVTGISERQHTNQKISFSISGKTLRLSGLPSFLNTTVALTDMNGKTIKQQQLSTDATLSIEGVATGIYILTFFRDNMHEALKVLINE